MLKTESLKMNYIKRMIIRPKISPVFPSKLNFRSSLNSRRAMEIEYYDAIDIQRPAGFRVLTYNVWYNSVSVISQNFESSDKVSRRRRYARTHQSDRKYHSTRRTSRIRLPSSLLFVTLFCLFKMNRKSQPILQQSSNNILFGWNTTFLPFLWIVISSSP